MRSDTDIEAAIAAKIRQEELAHDIAERYGKDIKDIFYRLPHEVPPGGLYTTPIKLRESGITDYSRPYIYGMIRDLPGVEHISSQTIMSPEVVQFILDRQARRSRETGVRGNRPGKRFPQRRIG